MKCSKKMIMLFYGLFQLFLTSCFREEPIPTVYSPDNNVVVWKQEFPQIDLSANNFIYDNLVIQGFRLLDNRFKVVALSLDSGKLIWEQDDFPTGFNPFNLDYSAQEEHVIVFARRKYTVAIDARNGQKLWEDVLPPGDISVCIIDGYVYRTTYFSGLAELYRYNLYDGSRELLFTLSQFDHGDGLFVPTIKMPVSWKNANNEDCLILHNRGYWKTGDSERMDIMCFNLSTRKMDWYRKGLDDRASNARPVIDQNRVYFLSIRRAFCVDANNGNTIWTFLKYADDNLSGFKNTNFLLHKGLLIAKSESRWLYGINQYTGSLAWVNSNTAAMANRMIVHNDTLWFAASGLWAFDLSTGKALIPDWTKASPNGYWSNAIVHHPTKGYIYTNDGRYIYCLDVSKMQSD